MNKIIKTNNEIIKPKLTPEQFIVEYRKKMEELNNWAEKEGYQLGPYLEMREDGILPKIGFRQIKK